MNYSFNDLDSLKLRRSVSIFTAGFLLAAIASSFFALPCPAQQIVQKQIPAGKRDLAAKLSAIEDSVNARRQELGIPGVSLAIVKDDKIIFMKGFGERDVENKLPVTPDTLFAIGSSTKAFTSMLAAMSADEGKLSFDDSPKKFIPYFKLRDPEADSQVTLRDLFSHRTGLSATDLAWATGVLSREEVIKVAGQAKPTASFRQKFQYQNVMYMTAGEATAQANKKSWENLLNERILNPLGMTKTNSSIQEMQKSIDFSKGYEYDVTTKKTRKLKMIDLSVIAPAGAINSNARDMAQWVRFMLGKGVFEGKRLVSEKNFNELVTPQINITPDTAYGLGWFLSNWKGHSTIFHAGNIDGFNAMVAMMPDRKLGLVMLSNVSDSPLSSEVRKIVWNNLLEDAETKSVSVLNNPSAAEMQRETGAYKLAQANLTVEIAFKEGKLNLIAPNQPEVLLQPVGGRRYKFAAPEGYFVTFRPAKDDPNETEMLLEQPQGSAVLSRAASISSLNTEQPEKDANLPAVDELTAKMIAAAGGESNLRKHHSLIMRESVDKESQGIQAEVVEFSEAPNKQATRTTLIALEKKIGGTFEYFDGASGGADASFGTPQIKTGKELANARLAADFYPLLDARRLFKSIEVKRRMKLGDEDVFVVVKTPPDGSPITEFVSAKSFLVLRRDTLTPISGTDIEIPFVERFSDFRESDGVLIPYKIMSNNQIDGDSVTTVKEIKFNENIPDEVFQSDLQKIGDIPEANPADVSSINSIVAALYDVISGEAGKKRDWNRFRSLFVADGKMIPVSPMKTGGFMTHFLNPNDYVARSGNYVETNGFFESEISRKTEQFGNIAHVFSTYEGKHKLSDEKPFLRGINSIQLMNDGSRWWIVNVFWDSETPEHLLPPKYLSREK